MLDLHTNIEGHPYRQKESYLQKYRCTFVNPDPDLRQKILDAGGVRMAHRIDADDRTHSRLENQRQPFNIIEKQRQWRR